MADYEGSATYYNAKVYNSATNEYDSDADWLGAGLSYEINKSDDGSYYDLTVWARFEAKFTMGAATQSKACKYYVYLNGPGISKDGEDIGISGWQTSPSWNGTTTSSWVQCGSKRIYTGGDYTLWVKVDLDKYVGQIGSTKYDHGIAYEARPGYVFRFLQSNYTSKISLPSLITPPYMGTLVNANKKKNSDGSEDSGVSAASNSITVRGDLANGSDDATYWKSCRSIPPYLNDYDHRTSYGDVTESYSRYCIDTFKADITPRTTYTIYVYAGNSAGDQDVAKYINIRTLSDPPTVTVKSASKTLNSVTFKYTSNYSLNKIFYKYKIGDGNWSGEQSQSASGTTGSITLYTEPNTTVHIKVYGQEDWDNQKASEPTNESSSCTTYDKAYTKVQDNIIHNNGVISLSTTNPSGNDLTFQILDGNDVIFSQSVTKETTSISLSEDQWDNVYKRYGNNNSKSYTVKIITAADSGHNPSSYEATDTRTITLTGIQKTTHVGASGPKRAMVWYSENGVMKHAVVWVGAGGGTKRTI